MNREKDESKSKPPIPGKLDHGIERAVRILQENGIETYESCEGGQGHSYTEPTVAFHGESAAGYRAFAVCLENGLPVAALRRMWSCLDGIELTGPKWELVFTRRMNPDRSQDA